MIYLYVGIMLLAASGKVSKEIAKIVDLICIR